MRSTTLAAQPHCFCSSRIELPIYQYLQMMSALARRKIDTRCLEISRFRFSVKETCSSSLWDKGTGAGTITRPSEPSSRRLRFSSLKSLHLLCYYLLKLPALASQSHEQLVLPTHLSLPTTLLFQPLVAQWVSFGSFSRLFRSQDDPKGTHYQRWVSFGSFAAWLRSPNGPFGTHYQRWVPFGSFCGQNRAPNDPFGTHCQRWVSFVPSAARLRSPNGPFGTHCQRWVPFVPLFGPNPGLNGPFGTHSC